MRRRIFTFASALSLLLFAATMVMAGLSFSQPWSYPFPWRGAAYGLALQAGRLSVGNMPQVQAEERELSDLKHGFDSLVDAQHVTLQRLRYGTPEYVAAREALDKLRADYDARRRLIEARLRSTAVEHSLPLWAVLLVLLLLPALWPVHWVSRRPRFRRELLTPSGLVASLLLAVSLIVAGVWVWSYFGGDTWTFAPRAITPPIAKKYEQTWSLHRWVLLSRGQVQFVTKDIPHLRDKPVEVQSGYGRGGSLIPTASVSPSKASAERSWAVPGFWFSARPTSVEGRTTHIGYRSFLVSLWVPWLMCGLAFALWFQSALRRSRRHRGNRCQSCGYRLWGLTSGVCPECGTKIKPKASPTRATA